MPPKSFRRANSTFVVPLASKETPPHRSRRHVHPPRKPTPPTELEKQRIRRVEKAERDERMDIGFCLSPVKA
jgi:hypothetical protein